MAGQDRGPDPFRQRRGGASELHLRPAPKRARRLQGLALSGKQELSLTQYQIALMFTLQLGDVRRASARSAPWIKPDTTRWFITPALGILAVGLFLVPRASDFTRMFAVVAAVASSAVARSDPLSPQ